MKMWVKFIWNRWYRWWTCGWEWEWEWPALVWGDYIFASVKNNINLYFGECFVNMMCQLFYLLHTKMNIQLFYLSHTKMPSSSWSPSSFQCSSSLKNINFWWYPISISICIQGYSKLLTLEHLYYCTSGYALTYLGHNRKGECSIKSDAREDCEKE